MDWKPERELPLRFQIDTNRINARGGEIHMNRLQRWHDAEVIEILLSEPAFLEVSVRPKSAQASKGLEYIQTLTYVETDDERAMLARIERILFPGGAIDENQQTTAGRAGNPAVSLALQRPWRSLRSRS
jgi:hypothetical protein